jgi:hypothetical protein
LSPFGQYLHFRHKIHSRETSKNHFKLVLVAHTYNPSYSEGRDQEGHGSKPAQANSFPELILKKLITYKKRAGGVA